MKFIIANWKMNKTVHESLDFVKKVSRAKTRHKVVICPPFTSLNSLASALKGTNMLLGAQNMFHQDSGPYTGEISPSMLKSIGCDYVILGHSERRIHFQENNEMICLKVKAAQRHGLVPILCVGETLSERRNGNTFDAVARQLSLCLSSVKGPNILVAYEPVWAIGTGNNATPEQASEVHSFIKLQLKKRFGKDIPVIYGGSVSPSTIKSFLSEKSIDGVLVGSASLETGTFLKLI
ncbi:triose-phosphate isomerase [Candidatus Woesearchaeota archaeon]|nr:triose-phosphate isomerase [Candidatus Woesearchaeota archaeon]